MRKPSRKAIRIVSNLLITVGLLLALWPAVVWGIGYFAQDRLEKEFDAETAAAKDQQEALRSALHTAETVSIASPDVSSAPAEALAGPSGSKTKKPKPAKPAVRKPTATKSASKAAPKRRPGFQQRRTVRTDWETLSWQPSFKKGAPFARLRIPKIDLEAIVVEGTDTSALRRGPGHVSGTGLPGEPGNCAIAGHRSHWFREVPRLHAGDPVWVETPLWRYRYMVKTKRTVTPDRGDLLNREGDSELTLITCDTPTYDARYRVLVFCRLDGIYLRDRTN